LPSQAAPAPPLLLPLHPPPFFLGFLGEYAGYCKCSQLPMWVSIAFALNEHKLCTAQKAAAGAFKATLLQLSLVASTHKIYGVCMYFKF